jgi:hypothetical protein
VAVGLDAARLADDLAGRLGRLTPAGFQLRRAGERLVPLIVGREATVEGKAQGHSRRHSTCGTPSCRPITQASTAAGAALSSPARRHFAVLLACGHERRLASFAGLQRIPSS